MSERMFFRGHTQQAYDVVATSHLGLIQVEMSWTILSRHHDVATGTWMRRTYIWRRNDVPIDT